MDPYDNMDTMLELGIDPPGLGQIQPGGDAPPSAIDAAESAAASAYQQGYGGWATSQEDVPAEDVPGAASGWPSAVPIRPARWDVDTSSYRVAYGDTLSGLAATYLGTPTRFREIWDCQDSQFRMSRSMDELMVDEWIRMPPDALATLYAALGEPPPPGTTPAPPPPGGYPAPAGPAAPGVKKKKTNWALVGGIGAGIIGAGALAWALA